MTRSHFKTNIKRHATFIITTFIEKYRWSTLLQRFAIARDWGTLQNRVISTGIVQTRRLLLQSVVMAIVVSAFSTSRLRAVLTCDLVSLQSYLALMANIADDPVLPNDQFNLTK